MSQYIESSKSGLEEISKSNNQSDISIQKNLFSVNEENKSQLCSIEKEIDSLNNREKPLIKINDIEGEQGQRRE